MAHRRFCLHQALLLPNLCISTCLLNTCALSSAPCQSTALKAPSPVQGIVFVNEYALVRTLGKGSFGKVKLGLNTTDHQLYALKLIPKSRRKLRGNLTGAPLVAEADVIQEINVMKGLDHPNIVKLVEVIGRALNEPSQSSNFCSSLCILPLNLRA